MNIYLINETQSDITVHRLAESITMPPKARRMFNVSTAEKLTITGDIVIEPNDDDTVSTSDLMQRQILGIGGEFRKIHSIPDDADFAFAIVPPHKGDGAIIDTEEDGEEDESAN